MRLTSISFLLLLACVSGCDKTALGETARPTLVLQRAHAYEYPSAARFSDDGKTLTSVGYDGEVKEWNSRTGEVLRSWTAGQGRPLFSDDGRMLACTNWNGDYPVRMTVSRAQVSLWDTVTGRLLHTLRLADRPLKNYESRPLNISLAFSHDGKYLAAATEWSRDHVTIWDTQTGEVALQLKSDAPLDSGGFTGVAFSPDDHFIVTTAAHHKMPDADDIFRRTPYDATANVQLWNAQSGALARTFPDFPAAYNNGDFTSSLQIAFAPDGSTLAAVNSVKDAYSVPERKEHIAARLWDAASGELKRELTWEAPAVRFGTGAALLATLLPDGQRLALLHEGKIEIRNLKSGETMRTLTGLDPKLSISFLSAPENSDALWATQEYQEQDYPARRFLTWDLATGHLRRVWKSEEMPIVPLAFSRDATRMTRSFKNGVEILDAKTGKAIAASHLPAGTGAPVWTMAFDPQRKTFACAAESKVLLWSAKASQPKVISIEQLEPSKSRNTPPPIIKSLAFSPDGSLLAGGGGRDLNNSPQGFVIVWDAETGKLKSRFALRKPIITGIAFLSNEKTLAVGDGRGEVSLWNAVTGKIEHIVSHNQNSVTSLAISADSKILAWGSHQDFTKVWDLDADKQLQELKPSYWGKAVALSPDGLTVAGVNECDVQLWSPQTGELRHVLQGHIRRLLTLAFSPDGKTLASGSFDGAVRLWDAASGEEKRVFIGHTGGVRSIIFSPDGKILVSGSDDGSIKFWDASSGELLLTLLLPAIQTHGIDSSGGVFLSILTDWLAFTPDGFYAGSAGSERFISWRVGDKIFPAEKFKAQMHRPDLIAQVLAAPR